MCLVVTCRGWLPNGIEKAEKSVLDQARNDGCPRIYLELECITDKLGWQTLHDGGEHLQESHDYRNHNQETISLQVAEQKSGKHFSSLPYKHPAISLSMAA